MKKELIKKFDDNMWSYYEGAENFVMDKSPIFADIQVDGFDAHVVAHRNSLEIYWVNDECEPFRMTHEIRRSLGLQLHVCYNIFRGLPAKGTKETYLDCGFEEDPI